MSTDADDLIALEMLNSRIRTLLPEQYQDCYEDVQPVSMGSAGLKYGRDGKVAWNEMWGSFCDLAMAGGPPHKGTLLEPAARAEIEADPDRCNAVTLEICRGIEMVTGLSAEASPHAGWIRVSCVNRGTAEWLLRAITMENVAVRSEGLDLELPTGPHYRIEKEIKNVITAMAKTCHYWFGHTSAAHRQTIRELMDTMERESPLLRPARFDPGAAAIPHDLLRNQIGDAISRSTGLSVSGDRYAGWLGIECSDVRCAVDFMRSMVASNVLSRREGTTCFVPIDPVVDPNGQKVAQTVALVHRLVKACGEAPHRN